MPWDQVLKNYTTLFSCFVVWKVQNIAIEILPIVNQTKEVLQAREGLGEKQLFPEIILGIYKILCPRMISISIEQKQ